MPHFGLIDENLPQAEQMLLRAKLHWRGGEIRLKRNEIDNAVASYYDAFASAMKRFFLSESLRSCHNLPKVENLEDDEALFIELLGAGVLDERITMNDFCNIESILESSFANSVSVEQIKCLHDTLRLILGKLEVLPFSERELPKEVSLTT